MSSSQVEPDAWVMAQAQPEVQRFERVAVLLGAAFFFGTLAIGFALYLVEFQVHATVVKVACYGTVAVLAIAFKMSRPTSALTPAERVIRGKRRVSAAIGLMGAISILLMIVTAYQLHTWRDWLRLGLAASAPIGFGLLIRTRFTMGSG